MYNENDFFEEEIEFVLTKSDLKKIIEDNFSRESSIFSYFENLAEDSSVESTEINEFLENLCCTDHGEYEKLGSVLYAFYEYNKRDGSRVTIH